jgi:hypothetical protein
VNSIIIKLKDWIKKDQLSAQDVIQNLDKDFDGVISEKDLLWGIKNVLEVE